MYAFYINGIKCPRVQDGPHVVSGSLRYGKAESAESVLEHWCRCADTAHASMNQAIPEMDCAAPIIHKAYRDAVRPAAGPAP